MSETLGKCACIITVDNPFIFLYEFVQTLVKLFTSDYRTVSPMPNHVKIMQRQSGLRRKLAGKCTLPGPGTTDDYDSLHQ